MNDSLKYHVEKITKLPTLPVIAQKILANIDDDLISVNKLVGIIGHDPAISAKILSFANSAFLGFREPARTLNNAIVRIGFDSVKNIALAISVMTVLEGKRQKIALNYGRVFNHSIAVGITAKLLSERFHLSITDEILVAGTLHDIGLLILSRYFPDRYPEVLSSCDGEKTITAAEKEVFNFTHADIGSWLADKWYLPDTVTDTVLYHHDPLRAQRNRTHVAVVHIADYIAAQYIIKSTAQDFNEALDTACLDILGIAEDDLNRVVTELKSGELFASMFI
jgi:putative nucleotidyltransferase with HDIG domain